MVAVFDLQAIEVPAIERLAIDTFPWSWKHPVAWIQAGRLSVYRDVSKLFPHSEEFPISNMRQIERFFDVACLD